MATTRTHTGPAAAKEAAGAAGGAGGAATKL